MAKSAKKVTIKKAPTKKSTSKKVSPKKVEPTNKAEYICLWLHARLKNPKYDDIIVNVTAVFYREENIPLAAYKDKMLRLWQETNGEKFEKYDEVNVELVKGFKSMAKKGIFLMTKTK